MKKVIWKIYFDYEKEEEWLNKMSAMGLAMTGYTWCRYVFEDCEPGEYIYRLELLENMPGHPESQQYIRFMGDNGIEYVAFYIRWVYFRKKAADGAFDIYSDIESRTRHYKRILAMWIPLCILDFGVGVANLLIGLLDGAPVGGSPANLWASFVVFAIGAIIAYQCIKVGRKLAALNREKTLRE